MRIGNGRKWAVAEEEQRWRVGRSPAAVHNVKWEADIFVMNADGTDRRHLVPKPDSFEYGVDW